MCPVIIFCCLNFINFKRKPYCAAIACTVYLTYSISNGINLYLDLWNINTSLNSSFFVFHVIVRPFSPEGLQEFLCNYNYHCWVQNALFNIEYKRRFHYPKLPTRWFRRPPAAKAGQSYDTWVIFL